MQSSPPLRSSVIRLMYDAFLKKESVWFAETAVYASTQLRNLTYRAIFHKPTGMPWSSDASSLSISLARSLSLSLSPSSALSLLRHAWPSPPQTTLGYLCNSACFFVQHVLQIRMLSIYSDGAGGYPLLSRVSDKSH